VERAYGLELTIHDAEVDHNYFLKGNYGIGQLGQRTTELEHSPQHILCAIKYLPWRGGSFAVEWIAQRKIV